MQVVQTLRGQRVTVGDAEVKVLDVREGQVDLGVDAPAAHSAQAKPTEDSADGLVPPHGGTLVDRFVDEAEASRLRQEAATLPRIQLSGKQACDLEMIANGAFSPLTGFVKQADFQRICREMRLAGTSTSSAAEGTIWPIPIALAVDEATREQLQPGGRAALVHRDGTLLGVIDVEEVYPHDKELEVPSVYRTTDTGHPGVQAVREEGDWLVGGPVHVLTVVPEHEPGEQFTEDRLRPAETREAFRGRGWRKVAAFQTRNPIHRAHEYLTKCAQELTDGLLIHPLVGETKPGDIPAEVRMDCYRVLIDKYYVADRTLLSVMPAAMRYAGPREALLHALIRKNYGVSHFIVGRDHAGVGDYYGTYEAQAIFDEVPAGELEIEPLRFEHAAWCNACESMVSGKTCPHSKEQWVHFSGTKVRELLRNGQRPPKEFSRPEVADRLIAWAQQAEA